MTCSDRRHLEFTCGTERQVTPKSGFLGILYTVRYTSIFTDIFNVLKILVTKSQVNFKMVQVSRFRNSIKTRPGVLIVMT